MFQSFLNYWKQRDFLKLRKKPVDVIFSDIYRENQWGGQPGTFYSGEGTHHPNAHLYINAVRNFISEKDIHSILEIGCGDFSIMSKVLEGTSVKYIGGDVVDQLIAHHQKEFQTNNFEFRKLNAINDPLPSADLLIIRQVLQHLSNEHVLKILSKINTFRYALITEHLPADEQAIPNIDKITGPHIRLKMNSGIYIDQPPFSVPNTRIFLEYRSDEMIKGQLMPAIIRTYLVEKS